MGQSTRLIPLCPKCAAQMTQGHVLDRFQGETLPEFEHLSEARWVEGTPETKSRHESFFTECGFKSQKPEKAIPIGTFRCDTCGFLESYARVEFEVS